MNEQRDGKIREIIEKIIEDADSCTQRPELCLSNAPNGVRADAIDRFRQMDTHTLATPVACG